MADPAEGSLSSPLDRVAPVDVREALAHRPDLSAAEVVDLLSADQVRRWRHGERIPAEAYLQLHPAVRSSSLDAFELVYNEFVLREELGEAPGLAEFVWRFPQLAPRFHRQIGLHRALGADRESIPPLAPGQNAATEPAVAGYEIHRELGRGGMGIVYLAWQTSLNRPVALKKIRDGALADPAARNRFRYEAEAAARLRHPHIVSVYEVGEDNGHPFIALEYAEGGSLAGRTQGKPQPPADAARLVQALARAIGHAHRQGVIHRDLKPSNVLLQCKSEKAISDFGFRISDFDPKIADFGLAKQLPDGNALSVAAAQTETGAILGTPGYMAPEQAAGQVRAVGPAADIYSLGAVLYELLTGRPPFSAETPWETALQVIHEDPLPPHRLSPRVPRDLETICLKCLCKEPGVRYPNADALADDLNRFLVGEPVRAQPTPRWRRTIKWARRRPALAALLTVMVLAAVSLVGSGLWYNARLQQEVRQRTAKEAEAREQQRLATTQYDEARTAIRRMLVRLEKRELADTPRLLELRLQQLEDALAFYQGVLRQQDNADPVVRFDTAQAYEQAAKMECQLGRGNTARDHAQRAEELFSTLAAENPAESEYQIHRVPCLIMVANLDRGAGRIEQAEAGHRAAICQCEALLRTDPESPRWLSALAESYRHLGNFYLATKHLDQAEQLYLRAHDLGERLVRLHPEEASYRAALAEFASRLGHFRTDPAPEQAEQYFRQAEEQFDRLIHRQPEQLGHKLGLGAVYDNWGNLRRGRGRLEAALELYDRGIRLMEPVYRQEPHYEQGRSCLLNLHGDRAYARRELKRYADAVRDWDQAIELAEASRRDWDQAIELAEASRRDHCRSERANDRARAGDHRGAAADAAELAAKEQIALPALYNAAAANLEAVTAARQDARLSAAEKERLAEQYTACAVRLLARLQKAGFFKDPAYSYLVKSLKANDLLRSRMDFQAVLAVVETELPSGTAP